ncbi:MAG: oxidoreductase [Caldibacillus sp.]
MEPFRSFVIFEEDEKIRTEIRMLQEEDLPAGEVTIRIHYSSVNYKDALATLPKSGVVRKYPMVGGIDLAGTVISSTSPEFQEGDQVLVTGYDLGVDHYGGYSEIARVPAEWVVPLPDGLSLKEAMVVGTAGFTAALSIQRLEENGVSPDKGPVLVTGATGGVGSSAVAFLAQLGYYVVASTRKRDQGEFLREIGAKEIISTKELTNPANKALLKQQWFAAIDPVGGEYLPVILASIKYGGSVALSGLTGGKKFTSTVFPFILRGVNLLGIDSVYCPMETRLKVWERIAKEMKSPEYLRKSVQEITLDELPDTFLKLLKGEATGRTVVRLF